MSKSEYAFKQLPNRVITAPNRSQNLRSALRPGGIDVTPRTGDASWSLSLRLAAFGRDGRLRSVDSVAPALDAGRATFHWAGLGVSEWYVNDERGIEQGYTIARSPGTGGEPIVLQMAYESGLVPTLDGDRRGVTFSHPDGSLGLRYAGLLVTDARQRTLPASMSLTDGGLRISIDDHDAVYPITVDPVISSEDWQAAGDNAHAYQGFGTSCASAGDVNGDGYSDIVVGADRYDNGQLYEGRVFVWYGSASGLGATGTLYNADWTAEIDVANAGLGVSVSTAGDVNGDGFDDLLVGANTGSATGRAFIWHGSASGLVSPSGTAANANWSVVEDQAGSGFGVSVSGAGDVNADGYDDVVIGAWLYDDGASTNAGRAYVYFGSSTVPGTPWTARGTQANAQFGFNVAGAGDVNGDGYHDVVIGAPLHTATLNAEGAAFAWISGPSGSIAPNTSTTTATADWTVVGGQSGAHMGNAVSTAGDVNGDGYSDVLVSADLYNVSSNTDAGRAFLFNGSKGGLDATAAWQADGDQPDHQLGNVLSAAGDVNGDGYGDILIGTRKPSNNQPLVGVFAWYGSASGLGANGVPANADWWLFEDMDAGGTVACAGDYNGDGFDDILASNPLYAQLPYQAQGSGRIHAFRGSAIGLRERAGWIAEGNQIYAELSVVASAGDVNGDGFDDVIAGAPKYDNNEVDEGRVFVFHGASHGLVAFPSWMAESNQANSFFGSSVASAGDVNGDGYSDVIIGSRTFDNPSTNEGKVFVYLGSSTGLGADGTPANADWTAESDQASAEFGWSVASAGDVDQDSYDDVLIGARLYDNGQSDEGAAFLYRGSASGLGANGTPANADWTAESDQAGAYFAWVVASAGDVDNNGADDVLVGSPHYTTSLTNEGKVFVWFGASSSGLGANGNPTNADWSARGNQTGAELGLAAASAGSVNGDAYVDIVLAAPLYDNSESNEGVVFVYHGSASGLGSLGTGFNADWMAESNQANAEMGSAVGSAGDANVDGVADLLVTARLYDHGETDEGQAFVFYGSATGLGGVGTPANADWNAESNQAGAQFGYSAGSGGDVNGDGKTDLLVAARYFDNGEDEEGKAYLFYGTGSGGPGLYARPGGEEQRDPSSKAVDASRPTLGLVSPNPFQDGTSMAFTLPVAADVQLSVHDVHGRRVATLASGLTLAGSHRATWDGRDEQGRALEPGVYFGRLTVQGVSFTRRIVRIR